MNTHMIDGRGMLCGTPEMVLGSGLFGAMFGNRADNFLVFHRNPQSEKWNVTEIHAQKIKFQKLVGVPTPELTPVCLFYSYSLRRFRYLNENGTLIDPIQETIIKRPTNDIF